MLDKKKGEGTLRTGVWQQEASFAYVVGGCGRSCTFLNLFFGSSYHVLYPSPSAPSPDLDLANSTFPTIKPDQHPAVWSRGGNLNKQTKTTIHLNHIDGEFRRKQCGGYVGQSGQIDQANVKIKSRAIRASYFVLRVKNNRIQMMHLVY